MKKRITFLIIAILWFTPSVFAESNNCSNYTEDEYNYIVKNTNPTDLDTSCSNGTLFTDSYLSMVNSELNKIKTKTIQPRYFVTKLSMTNYRQDYYNYCGPASIKQVVQYLNGSSESQSTYANYMGTNEDGTIVYYMTSALNHYTSKTYNYVLGTNYNISTFMSLITNRVSEHKPIILHAKTKTLDLYNKKDIGHYITVNGYTVSGAIVGSTDYGSVSYLDTYYVDYGRGSVLGEHIDTAENVFGTVNIQGRYIIQ